MNHGWIMDGSWIMDHGSNDTVGGTLKLITVK